MVKMYASPKVITEKDVAAAETQLCANCTHRLRGVVAKPGRHCKHLMNAKKTSAKTYECSMRHVAPEKPLDFD